MCHKTYLFSLAGLCFVCCREGSYPTQNNQEGYPTKQMSEAKCTRQLYPVTLQILNLTVHRAPPTPPSTQVSLSFQKNPLSAPPLLEKWFSLFPAAFLGNPVYSKSILTQRLSTGSEHPLLLSSPAPSSPSSPQFMEIQQDAAYLCPA